MNYDPKIMIIKPGPWDKLSISLNYDTDPTDTHPVFLFVPNVIESEHYHIILTRKQAIELSGWLDDYLGE
jgi:hypothetical protein